ncbi:methyltransferase domain-containing protein [Pseudoalteromonas sp. BDTF-M6]|uniref:methyltransferase domain-containing protein n=1 Tax=Pseudoalteromonas sp. BDTF-M6 TaxID=2796132 RepID=UPI001BB06869|nr:methyltransferase domain-containing protein [Pseudoalteromonas sp. BDTF-M6]MBS3796797.1 methyltransferase domain-containing protein [Pseudoalteromonas sp. BDTF-M6]
MSVALKQQTQSHFSKAACRYQHHARVQASASEVLLAHLALRPLGLCLDLGAGPGVNSAALAAQSDTLLALDLSPSMLAQIHTPSVKLCADMDALPLHGNSLDTVFSNFAMQWSSDLNIALGELYRVLKPKGRAYLAIVAAGSLGEVKTAFASIGRAAINHFASFEDILGSAHNAGFQVNWQQELSLFDTYASAKEALKSLSAIGANSAEQGHRALSKGEYAQILQCLGGDNSEVALSYNVVFLELIK